MIGTRNIGDAADENDVVQEEDSGGEYLGDSSDISFEEEEAETEEEEEDVEEEVEEDEEEFVNSVKKELLKVENRIKLLVDELHFLRQCTGLMTAEQQNKIKTFEETLSQLTSAKSQMITFINES